MPYLNKFQGHCLFEIVYELKEKVIERFKILFIFFFN